MLQSAQEWTKPAVRIISTCPKAVSAKHKPGHDRNCFPADKVLTLDAESSEVYSAVSAKVKAFEHLTVPKIRAVRSDPVSHPQRRKCCRGYHRGSILLPVTVVLKDFMIHRKIFLLTITQRKRCENCFAYIQVLFISKVTIYLTTPCSERQRKLVLSWTVPVKHTWRQNDRRRDLVQHSVQSAQIYKNHFATH